ncbi:hypothetical protein [Trinickia fusca]|uniref:Uncharacterized protein n=1 Tax=Trinickia fusca TaxID=2419777 RepID=A0A494XFD2_9BURK|nr:hypothetical protein [Trinickia fusca]RKP48381.1 hypothetical protein D7S89_13810 [Trinickia fusca]
MQHTVIAFFDTYALAEAARDALLDAGLAREDITLQMRCEPTFASDATAAEDTGPRREEGLIASIERFFESLFANAPPQHETAQYAEAVRRGAVMLSVEAATDAQCELARATLERTGPIDIEARAATWHTPSDDTMREHSPLEELGLRRGAAKRESVRSAVRTYTRMSNAPVAEPSAEHPESEAAATAVAAGSAPGMGAVFTAGYGDSEPAPPVRPTAAGQADAPAAPPSKVPDEYLQDEEFHGNGNVDGGSEGGKTHKP